MSSSRMTIIAPILVITVGCGWLLTTQKVLPGIDWVWVLCLAVVGILIMALGGIDKFTVVVGPFLLIATVFSLLRQSGKVSENTEIPCLMIAGGLLSMISRMLPLPVPQWMKEDPGESREKKPG